MALLATQQIQVTGVAITLAAAAGGGDTVTASDRTFLWVKNASGSPITVTVVENDANAAINPEVWLLDASGRLVAHEVNDVGMRLEAIAANTGAYYAVVADGDQVAQQLARVECVAIHRVHPAQNGPTQALGGVVVADDDDVARPQVTEDLSETHFFFPSLRKMYSPRYLMPLPL